MENKSVEKSSDKDENLAKGKQQTEQGKPDEKRVKTVVPDNDNGKPGPSTIRSSGQILNIPGGVKYSDNDEIEGALAKSSNKGQGPAGENL